MDLGNNGEGPERGEEHEFTRECIELTVCRDDQVEMSSAT